MRVRLRCRASSEPEAANTDGNGTVKVVPEVDLKVLDPIWTTALITGTHAWLIYDTLFAPDQKYQVHPQMVEKYERDEDGLTWRFKLRDGLGWHDGTAVTARDCVASLRRWAARATTGKVMMERAERLDPLDDDTFILKLKEPFGLVLETLGRAPTAFMMRAKDAETDPFTQIKTADRLGPVHFSARGVAARRARRLSPQPTLSATRRTGQRLCRRQGRQNRTGRVDGHPGFGNRDCRAYRRRGGLSDNPGRRQPAAVARGS